MTDLDKFIEILNNQDLSGVKTHDWHPVKCDIETDDDGDTTVVIENSFIGFVFNNRGQFKYIFNWA